MFVVLKLFKVFEEVLEVLKAIYILTFSNFLIRILVFLMYSLVCTLLFINLEKVYMILCRIGNNGRPRQVEGYYDDNEPIYLASGRIYGVTIHIPHLAKLPACKAETT